MNAYAPHFSPMPTLTLPRSRLGLPYWALSIGVHLAVLAAGSALLPPSTPAALTLTVALAPTQPAALSTLSAPGAPTPPLRHAVGKAAPVARPAATSTHPQPPAPNDELGSALPSLTASSEPVSAPVAATAAHPPAATTTPTPLADSQWLSSTVTQRMNTRKRYPRLAQRLGLEGRVLIEAQINDRGQLVAAQITESSGHDMLDQDALALLKNVTPLDLPGVRLASLTRVVIPLRYRLE